MPTLAPIFWLPTPVLEEIFISYVFDSWIELLRFENQHNIGSDNPVCLLALVCRAWQATVYGCRRLWSRIDLTRRTRAQMYLSKAKGVPIHVQWIAHPFLPLTQAFPTQLLLPHAAMVETLEIVHTCDSILGIRNMKFPILKKLSLSDGTIGRDGGLGPWLPTSLPVLQDLRLM